MITIGVISDTHGLLREEALKALAGVDRILHAGDVGTPEVIARLEALAPTVAVRGNVDRGAWAEQLPLQHQVRIENAELLMIHILADLKPDTLSEEVSVVISGHSHVPGAEWRDKTLYLNPGSAGPRRFRLPISLARLTVDGGEIEVELIELTI